MKYVVMIGDGMADRPLEELGGRTPLQTASTPNMDRLVQHGIIGKIRTVPPGYSPGSDVANLNILGYDPPGILFRPGASGSGQHRHRTEQG